MIEFVKMQGLGNDFIVIDARKLSINNWPELARQLCHRRLGIGADQLLLLGDSHRGQYSMRIYNPDGSEAQMCGNGIRCLAKYIWDRGLSQADCLEIETLAGIIRPRRAGGLVEVDMGQPILEAERIPVKLSGRIIAYPLEIGEHLFPITCVSMGNPHCVILVENLANAHVEAWGPQIERHHLFPERTNVEFVQVISPQEIKMRVWERGAGITPACGTGACASAVAAALNHKTGRQVCVHLDGGDLQIRWQEDNNRVYMTGPAVEVFKGALSIT